MDMIAYALLLIVLFTKCTKLIRIGQQLSVWFTYWQSAVYSKGALWQQNAALTRLPKLRANPKYGAKPLLPSDANPGH